MSRSPQTHYSTRRSPLPIENADPSRFLHHRTSRDTHQSLAPERRQWPPSSRKFWIYESSSPNSSQDGKSSSSSASGGKSAGSETPEERRIRTASPYGSFFAEEMDPDTPRNAENNNHSFRQGDRQEHEQDNNSGVFIPTRKVSSRDWTSSQAQMAPVYPTFTSAVPRLDHYRDATSNNMTEIPFSALLAENSRRSQPPLSWRQGYPDHPNPILGSNSQYDPHQLATAVPRDIRQTNARDGSRRQR